MHNITNVIPKYKTGIVYQILFCFGTVQHTSGPAHLQITGAWIVER